MNILKIAYGFCIGYFLGISFVYMHVCVYLCACTSAVHENRVINKASSHLYVAGTVLSILYMYSFIT